LTKRNETNRWKIRYIDSALLERNPFFHRENLEEPLDEAFVESATRDLLQAVVVRRKPGPKTKYQIAFGHRRAQAFRVRGLPVPCDVRTLTDEEMVDYAFTDAFQREDHSPREETQLILSKLDIKLRHCEEYQNYSHDPLVVLHAMEHERTHKVANVGTRCHASKSGKGRPPTGKYPVPASLAQTVEKVFLELPPRRRITWSTFVREYLAFLDIPADVQRAVDAKGIPSSRGVVAAIARVEDPASRSQMLEWAKKRTRIAVHVADKRTHILNKCRSELEELSPNPRLKNQLIELILDKAPHPTDVKLEAQKLLTSTSQSSAAEKKREISAGVYIADSRDMREIRDGSIALIMTSPPYFNKMKFDDYLSRCRTANEFFAKVEPVIIECVRVMAPAGKLVLNWGEPIGEAKGEEYEEEILAHRWVDICRKAGLRLWGKWIWWKNPPAYAIAQDRVQYEDAARGDGRIHLNWEWLLVFRKPTGQTGNQQNAKKVTLSHDDFVTLSNAVWRISADRKGPRELAAFPEELVERVIRYYSQPGDTVLDPFLGSATTVLVARRLGRNAIGYEIAESLVPEIQARLENSSVPVFKSCSRSLP
jgi:site-specific DNA-methyltransferase (adenine-specific)